MGAENTFIAGADLREFDKPLGEPQLPAVIAAIESCDKPVVAALHGAALGGGLELELGCDARLALAGTMVGLPEVPLGAQRAMAACRKIGRQVGLAGDECDEILPRRIRCLYLGVRDRREYGADRKPRGNDCCVLQ